MCVRECVCLIPSHGDTWLFGRERMAEPVTGSFNLMAAMKVRGQLYSSCNTHWGIVSVCIKTQYTDEVVNRYVALQACLFSHMVKEK